MATRKISAVHPVTLTMNLPPLDESFQLVTNNEPFSQWYYANDGTFSPNRKTDNLVITPEMRVTLPETNQVVKVTPYNGTGWFIQNADGTWPASPIVTQEDGEGVDYYVDPTTYAITIKKNVLPTKPVVLRCVFCYSDPRAAGVIYEYEETVTLYTNQDSEVIFPDLAVLTPALQSFDPFYDESEFEFNAIAKWNNADITPDMTFVWMVKDVEGEGEETLVENFLGYVSGQGTPTLTVDAMFSENLVVILCARHTYTPIQNTTDYNPQTEGWYVRTVTAVDDTTDKNPQQEGWYVLNGKFYVPTQDDVPKQGVQYFTITYDLTTDETAEPGVVYYTTNGDLVPDKIYRTIVWDIPPMRVNTVCGGSNVIEQSDGEKTFDTIITSKGRTLTDEQKQHLLFNWKRRQTNLNIVNDEGWGPTLTLPVEKCYVPTNFTLNVKPETYVMGAYRPVLYDDEPITYDDDGTEKIVYGRV